MIITEVFYTEEHADKGDMEVRTFKNSEQFIEFLNDKRATQPKMSVPYIAKYDNRKLIEQELKLEGVHLVLVDKR